MIPTPYAVQFGESVDGGYGPNVLYPFVYSFVRDEDDTWEANKGANPLDSLGVLVAAGATVDHAIHMDPDYNFRLLNIRYSVYLVNSGPPVTYEWYGLAALQNPEWYDYQTLPPAALLRNVRITVSMHGPDGRYLYGGTNLDNMVNGLGDLLPVQAQAMQGYDYGPGQVRTPYLLPREGIVKLQITNNHASDLYVTGALKGVKIRV